MKQPAIKLQPFTLTGSPPAQAILLWEWSYTASGIAANGTLTSGRRPDANGFYQISAITGMRNGDSITTLEPAGQAIPGNEGFPVDNLITASGTLTANGFGYETAEGDFANPYFADFLDPPTYQEVFVQPAFSEVPIKYQAQLVPGFSVATSAPAHPGDALNLQIINAPRNGTLSLHGTTVQYFPVSQNPRIPVTFSFDLKDQDGGITPVVTVIAAGNGPHALLGAASGYTDIALGDGDNAIALRGRNNTVTVGSGTDIIHGGTGDTIYIAGNTRLAISGTDEMVFVGDGNAAIGDFATGLQVSIGPTIGDVILAGFASDPTGVIHLTGGVGGFADTTTVLSALASDSRGGTVLSLSNGHSLDFLGVALSQLHMANFQIG